MKKHTHKKPPKKLKQPNKKNYNSKIFALSNILVLITIALLGISVFLYLPSNDLLKEDVKIQKKEKKKKIYPKETMTFEEKTKALEIEYTNNIDNEVYIEKPTKEKEKFVFDEEVDETIKYPISNDEIDEQIKKIEEKIKKEEIEKKEEKPLPLPVKKIVKTSNLPKLAIIIDDVISKNQVKKALNLGYNVNMAFLPPTTRHTNSAKITKNLNTYMIHLPLQARTSNYEEENTLYISDTIDTIEQRIKALKKLYPKTKYINNHTGSKFTSNKQAMDKLFQILKKYNYTFIDSRTTAKSVAKESAKKYGVRLFSRNIFLDNKRDSVYIQKQLKKAIKTAKKNGSAIAIGHPHSITFKTLQESKHLLEGLELVFVHQL